MTEPLLEVSGLKKHFPIHKGVFSRVSRHVYAVDGVSFRLERGETLGLVGESGCGKSTVGRTLLKLLEPTGGTIRVSKLPGFTRGIDFHRNLAFVGLSQVRESAIFSDIPLVGQVSLRKANE